MILAFDRDERLGPRRAVRLGPEDAGPLLPPRGILLRWSGQWKRAGVPGKCHQSDTCFHPHVPIGRNRIVWEQIRWVDRVPFPNGKTVLIWIASPSPRGPKPDGEGLHRVPPGATPRRIPVSALARDHRSEGEDDHPLGLRFAGAAERADGLEEGDGGVHAPVRWRGWEVDHGRAGQFRIGDGRARSDADRGHQSSAYLIAAL